MRLPNSMLLRLTLAAGALSVAAGAGALSSGAQLTGQNKPAGASDTPTISVTTRLVVEAVVVKDKKGKPIDGLTTKDFTITEDGVPQKISFCRSEEHTSELQSRQY